MGTSAVREGEVQKSDDRIAFWSVLCVRLWPQEFTWLLSSSVSSF